MAGVFIFIPRALFSTVSCHRRLVLREPQPQLRLFCAARIPCASQVFVRGGLAEETLDSPYRTGTLGLKGAGPLTEHPCSLCKVKQSGVEGEVGGQLGDRNYDVVKNCRTRLEIEHGRAMLVNLGYGTKEAGRLSKELGIVEQHPALRDQPRALWDVTSMHSPMVAVGPELLHLNDLVS